MVKEDKQYWININKITIPEDFELHRPKKNKMFQKRRYFHKYGEFESRIILNQNYRLVDGYTSLLIAKEFDLGKVPVYFVK